MSEISRGDLDRLYEGIDDVRKAVTNSEIRLGAQINAQRVESDAKFVRAADLALVDQKVDSLAQVVKDWIEKKDTNRKLAIAQVLTFVGGFILLILQQSGAFK